jgi:ATP-dependent Lon protease
VIIPHGNAREIEELPEEVTAGVRFVPVRTMDEVLAVALRGGAIAPRPRSAESAGAGATRAEVAH